MKTSRITLGTAQLGMKYGIANIKGMPDRNEAINILETAWNNGINSFDTAPFYGESESIIGAFISSLNTYNSPFPLIISKLAKLKIDKELTFRNLFNHIKRYIMRSLNSLKIEKIPIFLLHNAADLLLEDGLIIECLNQLKEEGLIQRFGISAYDPADVEESLRFKEIDVIQVPINIFDLRLLKTDLLRELKKKNYIIFARSIYLQGLFFILPQNLDPSLKIAKIPLIKLRNLSKEFNINIAKLAFLFVRDLPEISSLVIGIESVNQLIENLKLLDEKPLPSELKQKIYDEFSNLSDELIKPTLWEKNK